MATTDSNASYSVTPTQGHGFISHQSRKSEEFSSESHRPANKDGRSMSSGSAQYGRGVALAALSGSALPGSFSTDVKSANVARSAASRADLLTLSITRPHNSSKDDDSLTIS